jgi:hypothetical protein
MFIRIRVPFLSLNSLLTCAGYGRSASGETTPSSSKLPHGFVKSHLEDPFSNLFNQGNNS